MIPDWIIGGVFAGIGALLGLVPSVSIPSVNGSNYATIAYGMNRIVPVEWAAVSMLLYFGVKVALQVWDLIVFVYHQFWGSE